MVPKHEIHRKVAPGSQQLGITHVVGSRTLAALQSIFWVSFLRHAMYPTQTSCLIASWAWVSPVRVNTFTYEAQSKLLVSPLVSPIILPYIVPYITPFRSLDYSSYSLPRCPQSRERASWKRATRRSRKLAAPCSANVQFTGRCQRDGLQYFPCNISVVSILFSIIPIIITLNPET